MSPALVVMLFRPYWDWGTAGAVGVLGAWNGIVGAPVAGAPGAGAAGCSPCIRWSCSRTLPPCPAGAVCPAGAAGAVPSRMERGPRP